MYNFFLRFTNYLINILAIFNNKYIMYYNTIIKQFKELILSNNKFNNLYHICKFEFLTFFIIQYLISLGYPYIINITNFFLLILTDLRIITQN